MRYDPAMIALLVVLASLVLAAVIDSIQREYGLAYTIFDRIIEMRARTMVAWFLYGTLTAIITLIAYNAIIFACIAFGYSAGLENGAFLAPLRLVFG